MQVVLGVEQRIDAVAAPDLQERVGARRRDLQVWNSTHEFAGSTKSESSHDEVISMSWVMIMSMCGFTSLITM